MVINFIDMPTQALIALNAQVSLNSSLYNSTNYHYQYTGVDKLSPSAFADAVYGPLFAPGLGTDMYYNSCNIDLSNAERSYNIPSFMDWLKNNPIRFGAANIPAFTPGSYGGTSSASTTNLSDATNPNLRNDDQGKYNRKVALVNEYIKKISSKLSDDELKDLKAAFNEAKKDAAKDYDKANKKMDKFLATLKREKLIAIIKEMYKNDQNKRLNAAQNIADKWLSKITDNTSGGTIKVDMSGVNANNILDVLGSFISKDTSETANWNTLVKNNYSDIKKFLVEKANQIKDSADAALKSEIIDAINNLPEAIDDNNAETVCNNVYDLYKILRKYQVTQNDANVYERYGLPEDVPVEDADNEDIKYATKNFEKEQYASS